MKWRSAHGAAIWRGRGGRRVAVALLACLVGGGLFLGVAATASNAAPPNGTNGPDVLRGTPESDRLGGLGGADRIYGYGGNDLLYGGSGPDLLVGGAGRDTLHGGPGNDRIDARDRQRDVISCGSGTDTVLKDPVDRQLQDCEGAAPSTGGRTIILHNRPWRCLRKVDLDLVKVTMRTEVQDAISLDQNCSGRVKRIEVDTWTADGIKVQNRGVVAHDLVIESGYIKCHDVYGGYHQDGIHVMGGTRLTFRQLAVDCLGNANLFLSEGGVRSSTPTDVVCIRCVLGPNSGQTLFFARSIRAGARDTVICTGRFRAIRVEPGAESMVNTGNTVLRHRHPRCADVTAQASGS